MIPNLFGRCGCNSTFRKVGDRCITQKPAYPTEAVIAEEEATAEESTNRTNLDKETYHVNTPSNITSGSDDGSLTNEATDNDEAKPSNLPLFTNKNGILSTQEDSPLMQAVLKAPTVEPLKRLPVSIRKDGEPNETIGVDEMTANLHANDQPIYRVVTQPTVDKKSNKKSHSGKPYKIAGHQKKSSLKGT